MDNLHKELIASCKYFLERYSKKGCSYGLVPDSYPGKHSKIASIAGSGFFFCALVVAVEQGLLSKTKAENICLKSLQSLKTLKTCHGWYAHFYSLKTGENLFGCEFSTIDTCLMLGGALTAGEYFGGECDKIARYLLNRANFKYITQRHKNMFSMSITYDRDFEGHWDRYAEQLIMYVLGVANTNKEHRVGSDIYYGFIRDYGSYNDHKFIYSWHNSLFTHQYSHAFVDFRNLVDKNGTDWFKNSVEASLASYEFSCSLKNEYQSINEKSWGLTACASKKGYTGRYGSLPVGDFKVFYDGTMAPCGALGSIVFTPKQSIAALNHYYEIENLLGAYGLYDSYNIDENYYCNYYIAINKGITLVMIANYLDNTIWKYFNQIDIIKNAMNELGFTKKEN